MKTGARILCVGVETRLLSIRCEVLKHSGYSAQSGTVKDAEGMLTNQDFDLVIVSAFLSEADQRRVLSAAGDTPTLLLQGMAVAPELLAAVDAMLSTNAS